MLKLLIVDDEPIIVNGLEKMVREANTLFSEVEIALDAFTALERMKLFHPDLVITDIKMPEMDGLELISEARRRKVRRFVVLTGYDLFDYAREALRLQVTDYLLKPIQRRELVETLNRAAFEIMHERGNAPTLDLPEPPGPSTGRIGSFVAYVRDHFMYDISLDDVAHHLGLHPNYVCTIVKRELGTTFVQYLRRVRIDKAKELLADPQGPTVEQVSKSVGFEQVRNFYRIFKRETGRTPGEFAHHRDLLSRGPAGQ